MKVLAGLMLVFAVAYSGYTDTGNDAGTLLPGDGAAEQTPESNVNVGDSNSNASGDEGSSEENDTTENNEIEGCGDECPEELCDEATGTCKECVTWADCDQTAGQWCKDNACVETLCVPGQKECQGVKTAATCSDNGEAWEQEECSGDSVCAYGECQVPVCEPGEVTCGYDQKKICNQTGTGWTYAACPPGFGCKGQECVPVRNNVIVVMDTSGSMAPAPSFSFPGGSDGCTSDADCAPDEECCDDILGTGPKCTTNPFPLCIPPDSGGGLLDNIGNVACVCGEGNCEAEEFPQCESIECPISKLGLAKYTLNNLIESGEFDAANVVLQHFPQQITSDPSLSCTTDPFDSFGGEKRGWYVSSGFNMTGDDGSHITVAGDYFDNHLHEVLSVPFPATEEEDTIEQLATWIDGDETMEPTTIPCQGNNECAGGYCGESGGQNVCFYHGSPELRALGGTPLGRSLFYAGEYIRRHVVVGGKVCETDADCGNVNYYCNPDNKRCFDPLETCRGTVIVLLSDGACSPPDDNSSSCENDPFFEPEHTAKRLRYGLGCEDDSDCGEGSTCQAGSCQGYPLEYSFNNVSYTDYGGGVERLYGLDGQPIQVTTHTIFIHEPGESGGSGMNKNIADHGGGLYFDVETDKPEGLVEAINSILNVKENISNCVPFLPDGLRRL